MVLGVLPTLFGARLILLIGWFLARTAQRIVSSLLAVSGRDRLSERAGLTSVLGTQH
ncbi:MAG: mechanosensitive ion channel family protein, partial [bacterium]